MNVKDVVVVGGGLGGLAAAALLARQGRRVTVVEKNPELGGRARVWREGGFVFDMGPSWYLMPDVFERFFAQFGKKPSDYFDLVRLDPHYRVFFGSRGPVDVPADLDGIRALFESFEEGGGDRLGAYLEAARYQYEVAMKEFIYKEYRHVTDFLNRRLVLEGAKLRVYESLDQYALRYFQDDRARKILEYTIVFLGGTPYESPALYALMSHVDFNLGVWYPMGGMGRLVDALRDLAAEQGVTFALDEPVTRIRVEDGRATGVVTRKRTLPADLIVVNADYPHAELDLLEPRWRSYDHRYWERRAIAPSCYLLYLGFDARLDGLAHHNLYLEDAWEGHFDTLFNAPAWPDAFSYYISAPSRTDPSVAPSGCENVFVLVPVAPGLDDTDEIREALFDRVLGHMEGLVGRSLREHIRVKRVYAHRDFAADYNAYKGTALGLAHTLMQTAVFRPSHRSKKVGNLYYTGHYNHPGIGVPMVIISSQIVADEVGGAHG